MLWLEAFHVVFVVTWFAGLFYLPRLFVYHADAGDVRIAELLGVMERRLFVIMTIGAVLAVIFAIAMIALSPDYLEMRWLRVKMALVVLLAAYHAWCHRLMVGLREKRSTRSQRWYRMFNEIPGVLLIAIVVLAVVKPW